MRLPRHRQPSPAPRAGSCASSVDPPVVRSAPPATSAHDSLRAALRARRAAGPAPIDRPSPSPRTPYERLSTDVMRVAQTLLCVNQACARCASAWRSSMRRILPVSVLGRSVTNSIRAGTCRAPQPLAHVVLELAGQLGAGVVPAEPATTNALTTSPRARVGRWRPPPPRVTAGCSTSTRLDLERADPVAGRDDHVVSATLVPVVAARDPGRAASCCGNHAPSNVSLPSSGLFQ